MTESNTEQSSVKDRIVEFIKFKHLSQKKFEDMTGLSNGYINNMRKSIKSSTFDEKIYPIFPELNKIWLLYGEGSMINKDSDQLENDKITGIKSAIKNKPHDEQMEILYDKIESLESTIRIIKERDQLYFKSIIAHLGINDVEEREIKENKKSSTN